MDASVKGAMMLAYAANGSLANLKSLVAEGVNPSKEVNYDSRTPLHLASAEGHMEVVKYLVEEVKVALNPLDRWGNSPLADAIRSGHEQLASYLHIHGAKLNLAETEAARELFRGAAEGAELKVDLLIKVGVSVSSTDVDGRTALHMAAAAGHIKICEKLIAANADVNAADRWGATPITDATHFKHFELAQILRSASAKAEDLEAYKSSEYILASMHQTIMLLCSRDQWGYGAAWMVSNGDAKVAETWFAANEDVYKVASWRQACEGTKVKIDNSTLLGRAIMSNSSVTVLDLSKVESSEEILGANGKALALTSGFHSALFVPVLVGGVQLCVLEFRSFTQRAIDSEMVNTTQSVASRMIVGNLASSLSGTETKVRNLRGFMAEQLNEVFKRVLAAGFFTESVVRKEVDWYFTGLGMHEFYWKQFTPAQISTHVTAFIAAKLQGATTGTSGAIRFKSEEENNALYIYPIEESADVERRIESRWLNEGYQGSKPVSSNANNGFSIKYFMTSGTAAPDSSQKLAIYFVSMNPYVVKPNLSASTSNIAVTGVEKVTSVWKIATGAFLCEKSFQARKRYESVLQKAMDSRGAYIDIDRPTQRASTLHDSIVITIVYKAGSTHSFLSSIHRLLNSQGLTTERTYVESFSNGYVAYSFHMRAEHTEKLDEIKRLAGLTWLLPRTSLSPLVDQGAVDLPTSQWAYCAWKFAYHFLTNTSDEWNSLWEMTKLDINKRAQLLKLKKRLQNEVATEVRISETILEYPDLVTEMYQDFRRSFEPSYGEECKRNELGFCSNDKVPKFNETIWAKIVKNVSTPVDQEILRTILIFNQHILKTNFYKADKQAFSFRLNPAFLANCDYSVVPYGLFLVVGAEFRGFHVRFDDVARGGIRMIKSRNKQLWQRNAEGLFDENYNLAFTQTLKNKDIPESGSKGTVFLNVDHQDKDEVAFQKYIDAILDCILPSNEIVDHFGKPEILFFGPDEGTANFMDWAALHSKSRGYKFWSALTTGKSEALGGIPHDVFGMTTRGVHQYVLGLIRKLGLEESQLKKLQTGGPDGDLGSNEIKISHDKTIAIVDGSGVLYDPEGIDRTELKRLADARKMVIHFEKSKLSKQGFVVLIDDKDVTLPDGRLIDSGMNFRNNFHMDPLASCELFVPCGGRPAAVNLSNVDRLFIGPEKKPMWKYVVEGANLFFTQEARLKLEEAGVILFKDASANKGGVTSSSSEVLASLCMNDEEHHRLMCIKDGQIPDFYNRYVIDTQNRIEANADAEFECIWNESQKNPDIPRCVLTDNLSERINALNYQIRASGLWDDKQLVRQVLQEVMPPSLLQELGLDKIIERLPKSYVDATLSSYLAARYVYSHGLQANEFAFYQFMAKYRQI